MEPTIPKLKGVVPLDHQDKLLGRSEGREKDSFGEPINSMQDRINDLEKQLGISERPEIKYPCSCGAKSIGYMHDEGCPDLKKLKEWQSRQFQKEHAHRKEPRRLGFGTEAAVHDFNLFLQKHFGFTEQQNWQSVVVEVDYGSGRHGNKSVIHVHQTLPFVAGVEALPRVKELCPCGCGVFTACAEQRERMQSIPPTKQVLERCTKHGCKSPRHPMAKLCDSHMQNLLDVGDDVPEQAIEDIAAHVAADSLNPVDFKKELEVPYAAADAKDGTVDDASGMTGHHPKKVDQPACARGGCCEPCLPDEDVCRLHGPLLQDVSAGACVPLDCPRCGKPRHEGPCSTEGTKTGTKECIRHGCEEPSSPNNAFCEHHQRRACKVKGCNKQRTLNRKVCVEHINDVADDVAVENS